jgi:hypothetical protein
MATQKLRPISAGRPVVCFSLDWTAVAFRAAAAFFQRSFYQTALCRLTAAWVNADHSLQTKRESKGSPWRGMRPAELFAKLAVNTVDPVSAACSSNQRRGTRAGRILVKRAIPVGAEYPQRLIHDVSTEDRAVFTTLELYGNVANGVSRSRMGHKASSQRTLPVGNFRRPTLDHGQNTVFVDSSVDTLLPRGTSPMLAFCLKETVSRVRKRRHPATVEQPCMPSTMIDMKMRAHHVVHRLWRNSGCRQPFEKRQIELVKAWDAGPVLVIAGKTVDQNRMMTGAQNPRANT